jgi:peptide/nickel transport system permease protein
MPSRAAATLLRSAAIKLLSATAVVLVAGLACATMVRFAPGFGVDERELDGRLNSESIAALRNQSAQQSSVAHFYFAYVRGLLHGDLGQARTFSQPVAQLLKDRAPVTERNIAYGLGLAWAATLASALVLVVLRSRTAELLCSATAVALISLPAAVLALLAVMARKPAGVAIAAALFPVLFRYARNVLQKNSAATWVMAARARGVTQTWILLRHILRGAAPELIALGGISLNMAFGAALPVEVVADSAGIGQLAWQAALARDLPLLVTITGIVAALTLLANAAASLVQEAMWPENA